MGTVRVERQVSALQAPELKRWYADQLNEMAREGGTDAYCGNWNSNEGLCTVTNQAFTAATAEAYLDKHLSKRGIVYALKIGDFGKAWPVTKAQATLVERLTVLNREMHEFDYRILERAKKQKSRTKKCAHCESTINVHKLVLPRLSALDSPGEWPECYVIRTCGKLKFVSVIGLTDCPVCQHNLLKTETDLKTEATLEARTDELRKKVQDEKRIFELSQKGTQAPYWLVSGDCGC